MYKCEFFVYEKDKPFSVCIRPYKENDFDGLIEIQSECFPPPFQSDLWWNKEQLASHVKLFPEGALCVSVDGELAGSLTGLRVNFDPAHPDHTWEEITDNGYIRNHHPEGNSLYIVDISVRPKYRKLGLGKLLMQSMYHVVIDKGIDRLVGGSRMPGYHKVSNSISPQQYLEKVMSGELRDPVVSFLLRCGRMPVAVVKDYLEDEESCHYAVIMEWKNPFKNEGAPGNGI
ncbi:GNAT family N-acetyltransferase [Neobacillus notoginsengisoli]|uniref:GNAT family N-acetyltransferase n=1 Tax=Neobacillus notoginsengisoli TaxID=1578198 RepID=A0A417YJR0_9BACI|nr:GNAT family N-acetyltransferase [Neobacillus notoginsengisoli]RHW33357.1 GNAT family N-acetyltransferase [Neobacillus notoginsengisoli]